jgi:hypothetical protein
VLESPQHLRKLRAVDKVDGLALRKLERLIRVYAAGDEDCPVGFLSRRHTKKLANRFHPDFECPPTLALNNRRLAITAQTKVDTAVSAATANLLHSIALLSVYLSHLPFEILPSQLIQPIDVEVLLKKSRTLLTQSPPGNPISKTDHCGDEADEPAKHPHLRHFVTEPKAR